MSTPTLPGWLQVVLVWLCGVVGWLLLRPYRRITQLGGKDSSEAVSSAGSWHRRFFRDMRTAARLDVAEPGGTAEPVGGRRRSPDADADPATPGGAAGGPGRRRRPLRPSGRRADAVRRRWSRAARRGAGGGGQRSEPPNRARSPDADSQRPGPSRTCRRRTRRSWSTARAPPSAHRIAPDPGCAQRRGDGRCDGRWSSSSPGRCGPGWVLRSCIAVRGLRRDRGGPAGRRSGRSGRRVEQPAGSADHHSGPDGRRRRCCSTARLRRHR